MGAQPWCNPEEKGLITSLLSPSTDLAKENEDPCSGYGSGKAVAAVGAGEVLERTAPCSPLLLGLCTEVEAGARCRPAALPALPSAASWRNWAFACVKEGCHAPAPHSINEVSSGGN